MLNSNLFVFSTFVYFQVPSMRLMQLARCPVCGPPEQIFNPSMLWVDLGPNLLLLLAGILGR